MDLYQFYSYDTPGVKTGPIPGVISWKNSNREGRIHFVGKLTHVSNSGPSWPSCLSLQAINYITDFVSFTPCIFLVVGKTGTSRPQTGSGIELGANDTSFSVQVVKCFYDGCIPPHNPEEDEPKADRDDPYYLWTNTSLWKFDSETSTYFVNESGTEVNQLPPTDADVTIMKGMGLF